MAKKVDRIVKIELEAGKATPAPPVGTIFGPLGINLQEFCSKYNEMTKEKMGNIIPVEVSVYEDRTFSMVLKTSPSASLLIKAAGIKKGSVKGANEIVATISKDQLREIALEKMPDLNAYNVEEAMSIVAGTARNMGIAVKGLNDEEMAEQVIEAHEAEEQAAKLDAELEEMEESAKAMAEENASVEVESTEQSDKDEEEKQE